MPDTILDQTEGQIPATDQSTSDTNPVTDSPQEENSTPPEQLLQEVLASPAPSGLEKFTLSSGVTVIMKEGKGRDLLAAQRAAGSDTALVSYGLIAALCLFDGQKKVMEDILEMPLGDVMQLIGKVGAKAGGDFLPSPSETSSISPQSLAGATTN